MRDGRHPDGAMVLRAKIDMAHPNINLRDPALYRIKRATHHNTGDTWCIYPMYSYAHPIEDALENISHSICMLEFEDQRPFYDWTLERLVPVLREPQFQRARQLIEKIAGEGIEAGKEFALHCHNQADKLFASDAEAKMRALFRRWDHDSDRVLNDLPQFFALLQHETAQFTPLLAHALDGEAPNVFLLPHQYEFARLNLTYIVTSKRKLKQLVDEHHVDGSDDPRMPTLVGLRRRGYTPESLTLMAERSGVSKAGGWIDYSSLDIALRDDLDPKAPRACAVLDPLKLRLVNFADEFGSESHGEPCHAPVHPAHPELGKRDFMLTNELWIEREDFMEVPSKGYHRLYPGNRTRLKYGYVIECTGCEKDAAGNVTAVLAQLVHDTKSGTPGADAVKVKGVITWVSASTGIAAEVRLYERLVLALVPELLRAKGFEAAKVLKRHGMKFIQARDTAGGLVVFWLKQGWSDTRTYSAIQFGMFSEVNDPSSVPAGVFIDYVAARTSSAKAKGATHALLVHMVDSTIKNYVALPIADVATAYRDQIQRWPARARNTKTPTLYFEDSRNL